MDLGWSESMPHMRPLAYQVLSTIDNHAITLKSDC
jgi:hypothetical protein